MHHFDQLAPEVRARLFLTPPANFTAASAAPILAQCLGATLYVPGTRPELVATIRKRIAEGSRSIVIDLEDAVEGARVSEAFDKTVAALADLSATPAGALVFVRVRSSEQVSALAGELGSDRSDALAGFVLPKFTSHDGGESLDRVGDAATTVGHRLWVMPVLETPEVLYRESRSAELTAIGGLLAGFRDSVLAVRFGATDLCGLYGIRRDRDLVIYDVHLVASLIADTVNHLGRLDGTGFAISGPVWEHFPAHERIFRPLLRETPFVESDLGSVRSRLVARNLDGLIREVVLDRANGLVGKTVIHPVHVAAVHALSVVAHEEFADATDILGGDGGADGGAMSSGYRNKMNEKGPHRRWAQQVLHRAHAFGVARPEVSFAEVLAALLPG